MDAKIWGPTCWTYLHFLSMNYPENPTEIDKEIYRNFIIYLGRTLPCIKCRKNFNNHIQQLNLSKAFINKNSFIEFIWELHNTVNQSNTKTFDKFIKLYKQLIKNKSFDPILLYKTNYRNKTIIIALILIIIITLLMIIIGITYKKIEIKWNI